VWVVCSAAVVGDHVAGGGDAIEGDVDDVGADLAPDAVQGGLEVAGSGALNLGTVDWSRGGGGLATRMTEHGAKV